MNRARYIRIALIVLLIAITEAVCRLNLVPPGFLVAPSVMFIYLLQLLQTAEFWGYVQVSARAIAVAFTMAMVVGSIIAAILYKLPKVRLALEPLIASYYALPIFVLYPVFVVMMGMNQWPIILIGFLLAVVAVIVGTLSGFDRVPSVLIRSGRTYGLSPVGQTWFIFLPCAAPYVFTSAKLALGYSITGVLGSEFILASGGYGYEISFAYNNFEDRKMYALLLFLIVVVSLLTWIIYQLEERVKHRTSAAKSNVAAQNASIISKLTAILAVALFLIFLWQWVHLRVGDEALAGPVGTVNHLVHLLGTERFWGHINETALALLLAVVISCGIGAVIGMLIGMNRLSSEVSSPLLVTLYALPKVTLYPVILLFVGIGMSSKVTFGVLHGMIPMMLISMNAVAAMNPTLLLSARAMRLSRAQTLLTVMLPAAMPELATGVRVSFSITLLGVLVGELFASRRGLGFLIMNSININDTATMMAVTILIAVFAIAVNAVLLAVERRFHHAS
jgi:ABC-type nitrate/sulfonate/bicarbonate transport system permease component